MGRLYWSGPKYFLNANRPNTWGSLQGTIECGFNICPRTFAPLDTALLDCFVEEFVQILVVWSFAVESVMRDKAQDKLYIFHALSLNLAVSRRKKELALR